MISKNISNLTLQLSQITKSNFSCSNSSTVLTSATQEESFTEISSPKIFSLIKMVPFFSYQRWFKNCRFRFGQSFRNSYQNFDSWNWNFVVQSPWSSFGTKTIQSWRWYLGCRLHFRWINRKKTAFHRRFINRSNLQNLPIPWNPNSKIMVKHPKASRFQANIPKIQVSGPKIIFQEFRQCIIGFVHETGCIGPDQENFNERGFETPIFQRYHRRRSKEICKMRN